jgi:hypothetical protein
MIVRLPEAHRTGRTPRDRTGRRRGVRGAIVEDDRTMRDGPAALMDGTPGCHCVGWSSSVEAALQASRLRVRSKSEAVSKALRRGLIS